MKRPREHSLEYESRLAIRNLLPPEWIVIDKVPDYGIDMEVQIVEDGELTNKVLWLQIKSTDKRKKVLDKISYNMGTKHLMYYENCRIPVIIVYGIKKNENNFDFYFLFAQRHIKENLTVINPRWRYQKTVNVSFDSRLDDVEKLNSIATDGYLYVARQQLHIRPKDEFEYDLALSFAGEDREIAEDIANALIAEGIKVFYDSYYKIEMWGKKLTHYFQDVYGPKAKFVMVLISKHYSIKDWTNYEFSIARGEARKRKKVFILPVKLDNTRVVGIHEDVAYLDLQSESIEGIVDAVSEKLNIKKRISKTKKGIFITTLGVNFEDLVQKEIISEDDWRDYPKTCDRLEADLREKLDKSSIGEYHFTESSARTGETLSVRFAHKWDLARGLPDFNFTYYWDFLEFRPIEEIYPDSHKKVKSMFTAKISAKENAESAEWPGDAVKTFMEYAGSMKERPTTELKKLYDKIEVMDKNLNSSIKLDRIKIIVENRMRRIEEEEKDVIKRIEEFNFYIDENRSHGRIADVNALTMVREHTHDAELRAIKEIKDTLLDILQEISFYHEHKNEVKSEESLEEIQKIFVSALEK